MARLGESSVISYPAETLAQEYCFYLTLTHPQRQRKISKSVRLCMSSMSPGEGKTEEDSDPGANETEENSHNEER